MRPLSPASFAAAMLIAAGTSGAEAVDLTPVGVLDLLSENVPGAELRILSDRLRLELFNSGRLQVIERQRMEDVLAEQGFQQSGCVATECVVDLGQLIGVRFMVAGSIGRVGAVYTLAVRMIDVETGAVERVASRDCVCPLEEMLTRVIGEAAGELAGVGPRAVPRPPAVDVMWLIPQEGDSTKVVRSRDIPYSQHFGRMRVGRQVAGTMVAIIAVYVLFYTLGATYP